MFLDLSSVIYGVVIATTAYYLEMIYYLETLSCKGGKVIVQAHTNVNSAVLAFPC